MAKIKDKHISKIRRKKKKLVKDKIRVMRVLSKHLKSQHS